MMTQFKFFKPVLAAAISLLSLSALSADLKDPQEIVRRAELAAYYAGQDGRSEARMLISDSQGRRQTRQFTILRRDTEDGGSQDMLVFFSRPADVRDTVFRVAKRPGRDDDRWLYLPGLDLVKRIAAGDKRTSFVGSHFYYEDASGRNPAEDNFRLIETSDSHYVLEATPRDPGSVRFARYEVRIDKATLLPVISRYFTAQNKAYREVEALKTEMIQGHPTVTHSRVKDLESGGETQMQFRNIKYDLGLPEDIFSERSLRNPPRQWLE